ncbi:MAG TPA: histidine kinase, partial [Polyangiaceae bacterium]|nr:histidine kinase [Polyangiaceae bacterium]
ERPLAWPGAASTMISMWVWAALSLPIWWLAGRVPVGPGRWARSLSAHAGLAAAMALASAGAQRLVTGAAGLPPPRASLLAAWLGELVIDALCYAGLVALAHALRYHDLYRDRQARAAELEAEVLRARLRALEMQLRPHVLFNTLHAVSALVRTNRGEDAVRVVAGLGDLLRALLRDDAPRVRLREELGLLERYLRIERIRFGDRLEVRVEVEPDAEGALVPRWLLQPLVENAVRHGLGGGGAGRVEIGARRRGGALELSVRNEGSARHEGAVRTEGAVRHEGSARHEGSVRHESGGARPTEGAGVGLSNTRERLRCLYGERADLSLCPLEGGGAEVRIVLPFELDDHATGPAPLPAR